MIVAEDRTSYGQSLTHMIKGNLGAGLLGMGSSFAHLGLGGAAIVLPVLCLMSAYCVHLLVRSAREVSSRLSLPSVMRPTCGGGGGGGSGTNKAAEPLNRNEMDYPSLARQALDQGPKWARPFSKSLECLVDAALLVTQIGICCVYIVFVVDNVTSILASYHVHITKSMAFLAIFPLTLLLSFIRTLKRLAVASLVANLLQFVGLALIIEFLMRDMSHVDLRERDTFRPPAETALGFGSAMFAFEGISVVLPIFARMRKPQLMTSTCGIVNMSYLIVLILYSVMGLLSYLKYGRNVRDSITLNLPAEPLYDLVRAMFTCSILLTYPLQFYVPNEMIWKWTKKNLLKPPPEVPLVVQELDKVAASCGNHLKRVKSLPFVRRVDIVKGGNADGLVKQAAIIQEPWKPVATNAATKANQLAGHFNQGFSLAADEKQQLKVDQLVRSLQEAATNLNKSSGAKEPAQTAAKEIGGDDQSEEQDETLLRYEYYCRIIIVLITFSLAVSVPKLNLLMDLIGSLSGAALCLTIPAIIHLAITWQNNPGLGRWLLIALDLLIIVVSFSAGLTGSITSLLSIIRGH